MFKQTSIAAVFAPIANMEQLSAVLKLAEELLIEGAPEGRGPVPAQACDAALLYAHAFSSFPAADGTFASTINAGDGGHRAWLDQQRKATTETVKNATQLTSSQANQHVRKYMVMGIVRATTGVVISASEAAKSYDVYGVPKDPTSADVATPPMDGLPPVGGAAVAAAQPQPQPQPVAQQPVAQPEIVDTAQAEQITAAQQPAPAPQPEPMPAAQPAPVQQAAPVAAAQPAPAPQTAPTMAAQPAGAEAAGLDDILGELGA